MFTAYARHSGNGQHTEAQCATLDEALTHLRELITNEIADPEGPLFWTYGIEVDPSLAVGKRPTEYHFPKVCSPAKPRPHRPRARCVTADVGRMLG